MIASAIKFHASYLGVLLFSFGFLQFGKLGRAIAIAPWPTFPAGC
jgi:hypothetical protein